MTTTPIAGQMPPEGIQPAPPERDLQSKNAFARAATPEYWSLDAADYTDVTPPMIRAADPEKFRKSLLNVPPNARGFTVTYPDEHTGAARNVPLSPLEYKLIPRTLSSRRYGEVVVAQTMSGRKSLVRTGAELRQEAEAHGIEAIERKQQAVGRYIGGTLAPTQARLEQLQEAAQHPGFWRMREGDMRIALNDVLSVQIPQALDVVGQMRNWSKDQREMAGKAVTFRLFFGRARNQHLASWHSMLKLLADYNQEKINVFADRNGRLAGYLRQHGDRT